MKRFITIVFLIIACFGNKIVAQQTQGVNLVKRVEQSGLKDLGEIRLTNVYPASTKAVLVISELHIGPSQLAEARLFQHFIEDQGLTVIYTEGTDAGHAIDIQDYRTTFSSAKSKELLKQVTLEMLRSDEIGAVEYIQLTYPQIRVIGVEDRPAFDSYRARSEEFEKAYQSYHEENFAALKPYETLADSLAKAGLLKKIDEAWKSYSLSLTKKLQNEILPQLNSRLMSGWQDFSYDQQRTINSLGQRAQTDPGAAAQLRETLFQIALNKPGWLTELQKKTVNDFLQISSFFDAEQQPDAETAYQSYNLLLRIVLDKSKTLSLTEAQALKALLRFRTNLQPQLIELERRAIRYNEYTKPEALQERDRLMVRNLVQLMDQNHDKDCVLVVGAAHTSGILSFLKQEQISHALVFPANTCVEWKDAIECAKYSREENDQGSKILSEKLQQGDDYVSSFARWLKIQTKPRVYIEKEWLKHEIELRAKILYIYQALGQGMTEAEAKAGLNREFPEGKVSNDFFEGFRRVRDNMYIKVQGRDDEFIMLAGGGGGIPPTSTTKTTSGEAEGGGEPRFKINLSEKMVLIPIVSRRTNEPYQIRVAPHGIFVEMNREQIAGISLDDRRKAFTKLADDIGSVPGIPVVIDQLPGNSREELRTILNEKYQDPVRVIFSTQDMERAEANLSRFEPAKGRTAVMPMNLLSSQKPIADAIPSPDFPAVRIDEIGPYGNIIVIVGETNEALRQTLSQGKERFQNKYVVGFYCAEKGGRVLNFVEEAAALGQTTFELKPNPVLIQDVKRITDALKEVMKRNPELTGPLAIAEAFRIAIADLEGEIGRTMNPATLRLLRTQLGRIRMLLKLRDDEASLQILKIYG